MNAIPTIACLSGNPQSTAHYATLPGALCTREFPETMPRLFLLDLSTAPDDWSALANQLLRKRLPVLLDNVPENIPGNSLRGLALTARRNNIPLILLASWRYLPAVAAAKEILSTNCLGTLRSLSCQAPQCSDLDRLRLADLRYWFSKPDRETGVQKDAPAEPDRERAVPEDAPADHLHLRLEGENGFAEIRTDMDGQQASCRICLLGKTHSRHIPAANPRISEFGILRHCLTALPAGKIHGIPMLMALNPLLG